MQMFLKQLDDFHPFQGILNYDQLFLPYWRRLEEDEFENRLKRFADEGEAQRLRRMVRHGLPKDRIERALAATDKFFCELDDRLCRSKFVMGERYTLSDIALTPYINSSLHIISDLWFGKRKGISRWLEQIRERPNFHAAVFGFPNAPDLDEAIAAAPAGGGFRTL
jgi:glutathione S-transferase